jgi:hypothetical protein
VFEVVYIGCGTLHSWGTGGKTRPGIEPGRQRRCGAVFCGIGTKSKVAARRARYFFFLEAELFADGLFFLEIEKRLVFCFFLPLSEEVSLSDSGAEPFDFLLFRWDEGTMVFSFVEGAR